MAGNGGRGGSVRSAGGKAISASDFTTRSAAAKARTVRMRSRQQQRINELRVSMDTLDRRTARGAALTKLRAQRNKAGASQSRVIFARDMGGMTSNQMRRTAAMRARYKPDWSGYRRAPGYKGARALRNYQAPATRLY